MSTNISSVTNRNISTITIGSYEKITHPNVKSIVIDKSVPEAIGFNNILNNEQSLVYGFLSRWDKLVDGAIENIIRVLNVLQFVQFIYTDQTTNNIIQFFPSYKPPNKNNIINTPLFVRSTLLRFNEKFKSFYFFEYFNKLCENGIGYHIPEVLVKTQPHQFDLTEIYGQSNP